MYSMGWQSLKFDVKRYFNEGFFENFVYFLPCKISSLFHTKWNEVAFFGYKWLKVVFMIFTKRTIIRC